MHRPARSRDGRGIKGVTFDFYATLIRDRHGGTGRGQSFQDYLRRHGLKSDPWEHQVLYDVFEHFEHDYDPDWPPHEKERFWIFFTETLFTRTNVRGHGERNMHLHAGAVRDIFGPSYFELYPDVLPVLGNLRDLGFCLGIISNWQKGLAHFCSELGIREYFRVIISSAEVGIEKPDPGIFLEASRQLGIEPESLLHIGDQLTDDVRGATDAGIAAVWLNRNRDREIGDTIVTLIEIHDILQHHGINGHGLALPVERHLTQDNAQGPRD